MAKLKLKLNKQEIEPIFESDEAIVRRARAKMDADACIVQPAYRIANFKSARMLLDQAGDYPGARELARECERKEAQAQEEKKSADYTRAQRHLEQAESEHEFEQVAGELKALSGYRDADRLLERAQEQKIRMHQKVNIRRGVILALLAVLLCAGITLWRGGYMRYIAARLEGMGGMYESAYSRFYKLGDFLDSREQYTFYKEKYLRKREKAEAKALPEAEAGDTVDFSGYSWLVLERQDAQLLMLCTNPRKESVFTGISYGGATWAESDLRKKLNGSILAQEFTPAEQDALVPMLLEPADNAKYGTDGGAATEDLVRILQAEETDAYPEVFTAPSADMWLCTPGHDRTAAAYMTAKGNVMLYGNDVESDSLTACPLIRVDVEKLES